MALGRVTDRGEHVCCRASRPLQGTECGVGGLLVEDTSWINAPRQEDVKSRRGLPGRSSG